MCTVTYIPKKEGFYLTSNRDESVKRGQAITPREYNNGKNTLLYPKDADRNGSWIAAKDNGDLVVLLNGAFIKHTPQAAYKKSRGLVLMDIIKADDPYTYYSMLNLYDIEPFTIVLYSGGKLYECRWDGGRKHITMLDKGMAYIWSSVTLYDKMATAKRESWFGDWRRGESPKTADDILHFHHFGGRGDLKDGLVINRDGMMKTMSITNIDVSAENVIMTYHDLKDDKQYVTDLHIQKDAVLATSKVRLPRFLGLRSFFIRLTHWEYWPFNAVYLPVMFYWFWLSFKARSFFFFSAANPLIENGGFAMESKWLIYKLMPRKYNPETLFFKTGTDIELIKGAIEVHRFSFPMIAKPDIGGRGVLVKKVHDLHELNQYVKNIKVDFLLQAFIPYKNEVGIFYHRIPGESKGSISGIVGKEFLTVVGDGRSTIAELIINEPRYLLQLPVLKDTHADVLPQVLAPGKPLTLVPYGNHARGARFIDLSHLITDELTGSIDNICQQIPEFYFGRMDVMYNTWDELCAGKNLTIVELNGAGSEPTHIYDPKYSIFFAWKEIMRHWKLLSDISKQNRINKGLKCMTYREGITMLKNNTEYLKLVS
ncbi:NRDE family protein [Mucilaginibacter flavus]|uniref:NRDE family protein n=1 Tax=Mucilaginibacter flavus TaxID=931504 RepID=UPI0025B287F1|nr:NRDE family protein [Mucilaginibacter flavus]MDN3581046.1 NRDE family protein [Mucilaginibacter flavus]